MIFDRGKTLEMLMRHPLVMNMSDDARKEIADSLDLILVKAGSFCKAELGKEIVFVVEGAFKLIADREAPIRVGAGEFIEMRTLLRRRTEWVNRWQASVDSVVALVQWKPIAEAINGESEANESFIRRASLPSVYPLMTELSLFGFGEPAVERLRKVMRSAGLEEFRSLIGTDEILFVSAQEFRLGGEKRGGIDYFPANQKTEDLQFENDNTFIFWTGSTIAVLPCADLFRKYVAKRFLKLNSDPEVERVFFKGFEKPPKLRSAWRSTVRQHDRMDCGAACLASISRLYGRRIGIETFRELAEISSDGTSFFNLSKAAEQVGFKTIGIAADLGRLSDLRPPFVALMDYHFIVVLDVGLNQIVIMDPLFGRRRLTREQFAKDWSGTALLLYPTEVFFSYPENPRNFLKYWSLLSGERKNLAVAFALSIGSFVLGLGLPLFNQFLFDVVLRSKDTGQLVNGTLIALGALLFAEISEWNFRYQNFHLSTRIEAKFSAIVMQTLKKLPLKYFQQRRVGDFLTRLDDVSSLRGFFSQVLIDNSINVLRICLFVTLIWLYSSTVLLTLMGTFLGYVLIIMSLSTAVREAVFSNSEAMARLRSLSLEQLRGLSTIKALNATTTAFWRWSHQCCKVIDIRSLLNLRQSFVLALTQMAGDVIRFSVLFAALLEFLNGKLTAGQVVCVTFLGSKLLEPLIEIVEEVRQFGNASVALGRIDDLFIAEDEELPAAKISVPQRLRGQVEFDRVSFSYNGKLENPTLRDLSLTFQAGETTAVIGGSGSGKSTLGLLLILLHRPVHGTIRIDGIDTRAMPIDYLRNQVTVVLQEATVIPGTIFENIVGGERSASMSEVVRAAEAADAHMFISQMPKGYMTPIGQQGQEVSTGQLQRIALARALYRKSSILVLDEATSALDSISEKTVIENVFKLRAGLTTIVITHRFESIQSVNRVYRLDQGTLVESGSAQLLKRATEKPLNPDQRQAG